MSAAAERKSTNPPGGLATEKQVPIPCKRCSGNGVWLVPPGEYNADHNGYWPGDSFTTCTFCKGLGYHLKAVEMKTETEEVSSNGECTVKE